MNDAEAIRKLREQAIEQLKPEQDLAIARDYRELGPGDELVFHGGETRHPECSDCNHREVVRRVTYEEWKAIKAAHPPEPPKPEVPVTGPRPHGEGLEDVPETFRRFGETCMSNCGREVEPGAADRLRAEEISLKYAGWNFNGDVWFDRASSQFKCAVFVYHVHRATIAAATLEGLMVAVSEDFGWD